MRGGTNAAAAAGGLQVIASGEGTANHPVTLPAAAVMAYVYITTTKGWALVMANGNQTSDTKNNFVITLSADGKTLSVKTATGGEFLYYAFG